MPVVSMLYLSENEEKGLAMVSSIAEAYNIPRHFPATPVQTLTRSHLIKSYRGRNGGIKLARSSAEITILQTVNTIEGPPPEEEMCVIGLDVCADNAICPSHDQWPHIRDLLHETLSQQTLEELAEGMRRKRRELVKASGSRNCKKHPPPNKQGAWK